MRFQRQKLCEISIRAEKSRRFDKSLQSHAKNADTLI